MVRGRGVHATLGRDTEGSTSEMVCAVYARSLDEPMYLSFPLLICFLVHTRKLLDYLCPETVLNLFRLLVPTFRSCSIGLNRASQ